MVAITGGEIRDLHASFGAVDELLERRRAIYRLTLEAASAEGGTGVSATELLAEAVVDNPAVRGHLAEVLGGTAELDLRNLWTLDDLVVVPSAPGQEAPVRLVSRPETADALRGALRRLGADLGDPGFVARPDILLLAGAAGFDAVARTVSTGVAMALDLAPELIEDLLPHVALFAVLQGEAAGRLGSASVREYPGLVLLPEPRTPLEVAEALVHEGAHQKFFDLAMTNHVLATAPAQRFSPPWSVERAGWPFEQCVAAFHAYCCLRAFFDRIPDTVELHDHSLLPVAAERAACIGNWLVGHGGHLGAEGQAFVGGLNGREFAASPAGSQDACIVEDIMTSSDRVFRRHCGNRTLVLRWERPISLFWLFRAVEAASG
jgi:hypothetical protein